MAHWRSNLTVLCRESVATGRWATLPRLNLDPRHNLGIAKAWRWETYFDLRAGRLVDPDTGAEQPLPLVDHLPQAANTLTLDPGEPMPKDAHRWDLIVRRVGALFRRDVPRDARSSRSRARLALPPSAEVVRLARPVIDQLGAHGAGFAAVHVRRGDRLHGWQWRRRTSFTHVSRMLRRFGVDAETPVYVLSDERDPRYWAQMQSRCRLRRYWDFQELADLVSTANGLEPDNYLLFEVEKEILRHAGVRIGTYPTFGIRSVLDACLVDDGAKRRSNRVRVAKRRWRRRMRRLFGA